MLSSSKQIGYGMLLAGGLVAAIGSAGCASSGRQPAQMQPVVYDAKADAQRNLQQLVGEMERFVMDVTGFSQEERLHIFDSISNTNYEVWSISLLRMRGEANGKSVTYISRPLGWGLDRVIIEEGENAVEIAPEHISNRFGDKIENTNKGVWGTYEATYQRLLMLAYDEAKKVSVKESQKAKPLADDVNR